MGLTQWPTQEEYKNHESSSKSGQPFTKKPVAQVTIRWCTLTGCPGGRVWDVQPVVFNSDEGIFARKTWSAECVYWSQDTLTYLTHSATVQSVGLKDGNRIFVTGDRGHSTTLHEDDIDFFRLVNEMFSCAAIVPRIPVVKEELSVVQSISLTLLTGRRKMLQSKILTKVHPLSQEYCNTPRDAMSILRQAQWKEIAADVYEIQGISELEHP
ncbi:hypothetical protein D6C99_06096 [Aureobasidium pullulans]|nr:hypothetical protein D6C99_06096 [Aureobasidium pullulans]